MKYSVHMVGTTHFDPVWLWTWDEAMASIRSTFRSALDRMKEEPKFIYSFSCPPVFEWIKKTDPQLFEQIKIRVAEGRWELVEGWWLQPDCNAASGESYVRQGLYGQRYLIENFGTKSKSGFNTDSFGHNIMLPQILKKSGIEFYVYGRPSAKEKELQGPLFIWESPDGSRVLAYRCRGLEGNQISFSIEKDAYAANESMQSLGHDIMILFGVSNHGGAPTRDAIEQINKLIFKEEKGFDISFSRVDKFFEGQTKRNLPVIKDELNVKYFGVFSNYVEIKKNNRIGEYAVINAEKAAMLAKYLCGITYPKYKFNECWKDLLFNQFHDIIGGACIKNAYFDARNLHGRAIQSAREIIHFSLQRITKDINTAKEGFPVVIWNLNTFEVNTPVEAELQWAWEFDWYKGSLSVTDSSGNNILCQVIQEYSVLPGFRSRLVFNAGIPSLGYNTFYIHQKSQPEELNVKMTADDFMIGNDFFRLDICKETGCIKSITSSRSNTEILKNIAKPIIKQDDGDTWAFNVTRYGDELGSFSLISSRVVENGPVRAVIRTKGKFGNSYIEQDFTLYKDLDIIDGKYKVYWREKHKVLKLTFDTMLKDSLVTSSIPYGSIARENDGTEMTTGEWIDVSEDKMGVSIISDSFFAYDAIGSILEMTVLRSPIFGHLTWKDPIDPEADYEYIDQGVIEGKWRVKVHEGNWINAKIPQEAVLFNNPVITVDEANHDGVLPSYNSYLLAEGCSSLVTVLKESEEGNHLVMRAFEYGGKEDKLRIHLNLPDIASASASASYSTNASSSSSSSLSLSSSSSSSSSAIALADTSTKLSENTSASDSVNESSSAIALADTSINLSENTSFDLILKPYEIKTFRLNERRDETIELNMLEELV